MNKNTHGFTIVELLIVIVVIAILAAISIVAYNGIQNRANDTIVRSDLTNIAKQVELWHAERDAYPRGGGRQDASGGATYGSGTSMAAGFSLRPSKNAYRVPPGPGSYGLNLVYCEGPSLVDGSPSFRVSAISKSGNGLSYSKGGGHEEFGAVGAGYTTILTDAGYRGCEGLGWPRSWGYGFYQSSSIPGGWQSWTN